MKRKTGRNPILAAGIALLAISGGGMYGEIREYRRADSYYDHLAVVTRKKENRIDFEELAKVNADIVGWLSLEGTELDYPLVQTDNNEWYLEHLFTGEAVHSASLFVDFRNDGSFTDRNTIIYGHNMKDGTMFSVLEGYRNEDFRKAHPVLELYLPDQQYDLYPAAVVLSTGTADDLQLRFSGYRDFEGYMMDKFARSLLPSDAVLTANTRIVTLSTCRYDEEDGRLLVFCILKEAS